VGAIPTNHGEACVFVAMPPARFAAEARRGPAAAHATLLAEASAPLADAVRASGAVPAIHGFAGLPGFFRRSHGPGWALVGDAGYFKDPITAHGMSDALRDAELLARALDAGTEAALARYEEERDELSLPLFRLSEAIASFDWDVEAVKGLHLELSREMNREVEALRGLGGPKAA
jgi:2-polyprenyl-6-methoxyphenol hydroxylase-like FAD-dependent oxidoreductase